METKYVPMKAKPNNPILNRQMFRAADMNDIAGLKEAFRLGADPNYQNKYGYTALMWAAWYGKTEIARILIEAGAK